MMFRPASDDDVRHVFSGLTDDRIAEMTATAFHSDAVATAEQLLLIRPHAMLYALSPRRDIRADGERKPAFAIAGVVTFGPALGGMIWAPTPAFAQQKHGVHHWWRVYFVPHVLQRHYRRVEFTALASDYASRRWLKILGFTEEGTAYRQGKRGEDFVHCAWLNPDRTIGVNA